MTTPKDTEVPELILLPQVTAMLAKECYHYCADCKAHCRQLILTVEALKELNRAYTARVDPPAAPDERDHAAIHQILSEYADRENMGLLKTKLAEYAATVRKEAALAQREVDAKIAKAMRPMGGRMWTDEQSACFEALTDCAANIRNESASKQER